jgi:hypothetical protein
MEAEVSYLVFFAKTNDQNTHEYHVATGTHETSSSCGNCRTQETKLPFLVPSFGRHCCGLWTDQQRC